MTDKVLFFLFSASLGESGSQAPARPPVQPSQPWPSARVRTLPSNGSASGDASGLPHSHPMPRQLPQGHRQKTQTAKRRHNGSWHHERYGNRVSRYNHYQGGSRGARAPPIFGKTKTSGFSADAQSRFLSVVLGGVLGGALRLTRSMYLCSSGSNTRGEWGVLNGAVSVQKALQGSKTETGEFLGGTKENSVSRPRVIDLPSRQIDDFFNYLAPLIMDCMQLPLTLSRLSKGKRDLKQNGKLEIVLVFNVFFAFFQNFQLSSN